MIGKAWRVVMALGIAFSFSTFGFVIEDIPDHKSLLVSSEPTDPDPTTWKYEETKLGIWARGPGSYVGYFSVTKVTPDLKSGGYLFEGEFLIHEENSFPLIKDRVVVLDFGSSDFPIPGRVPLMELGKGSVPPRFQPTTYHGLILGETAFFLKSGEHLIDIFGSYFLGISPYVNLSTLILLDAAKIANASVKILLWDNQWFRLAQNFGFYYIWDEEVPIYSFKTHLSVIGNAKHISHTTFLITATSNRNLVRTDRRTVLLQTEIRSGYEYVLDDWDRLLYGPIYSFETKTIGAYSGFLLIWENLQLIVGVQTRDLVNLKLDLNNGYFPYGDALWRF